MFMEDEERLELTPETSGETDAVAGTDAPAQTETFVEMEAPAEAEAVAEAEAPAEAEAVAEAEAPAEAEDVAEAEAPERTEDVAETEEVEKIDVSGESEAPGRDKLEELSGQVRDLSQRVDALPATLQDLSDKLMALASQFDKRILYSERDEKIIDRMHRELQQYKQDLYAQIVRPILLDIAATRDSILMTVAQRTANGQTEIPFNVFSSYAENDLTDILEKNDVEVYRSKPGSEFDATRHRVIHKTPTEDKSLHRKIASSFSGGYLYRNRILSPEKVSVYVFQASSGAD